MVDTKKLRGIIAERGTSQRRIAKDLGMTEKTFYSKMKKGVFDSAEMEGLISLLGIENPAEIFLQEMYRNAIHPKGGTQHMARPEGCTYYAEDERGNKFIVWGPPPAPGDALCRALTGKSENQLVRDILEGRYDHLLEEEGVSA